MLLPLEGVLHVVCMRTGEVPHEVMVTTAGGGEGQGPGLGICEGNSGIFRF